MSCSRFEMFLGILKGYRWSSLLHDNHFHWQLAACFHFLSSLTLWAPIVLFNSAACCTDSASGVFWRRYVNVCAVLAGYRAQRVCWIYWRRYADPTCQSILKRRGQSLTFSLTSCDKLQVDNVFTNSIRYMGSICLSWNVQCKVSDDPQNDWG